MHKFKFMFPTTWIIQEVSDGIQAMNKYLMTIEFYHMTLANDELCQYIGHLIHINSLILNRVVLDAATFAKLVTMFKLAKLTIIETEIKETPAAASSTEKSDINLNLLVLESPKTITFNLLSSLKVQSRKIAISDGEKTLSKEFRSTVENFMRQQTSLRSLVIRSLGSKANLGFYADQMKDKNLVHLAVVVVSDSSNFSTNDSLFEIIDSHKSTLIDLEIRSEYISEKVLLAIHECRKLQTLRFDVDTFPKNVTLPARIQPNVTLRTLISTHFNEVQLLQDLFRMFPNITKLGLKEESLLKSNDLILAAHLSLASLKELEVPKISENATEVAIPTLQLFQVNNVESTAGLQNFLAHNPSLQTVKVNWLTDDARPEILFGRELVNLREVTIGYAGESFKITNRVLQVLNANCPRLQKISTLDYVDEGNAEENISFNSIRVVKFDRSNCLSLFNFSSGSFEADGDLKHVNWSTDENDEDDEERQRFEEFGFEGEFELDDVDDDFDDSDDEDPRFGGFDEDDDDMMDY